MYIYEKLYQSYKDEIMSVMICQHNQLQTIHLYGIEYSTLYEDSYFMKTQQ